MNTIYIIAPTAAFLPHFEAYQRGEGHYFEVGFKNFGAIRYSLDGSQVLLEEAESQFLPEHLTMEGVLIFRDLEIAMSKDPLSNGFILQKDDLPVAFLMTVRASDQALAYIAAHKSEWQNDEEL